MRQIADVALRFVHAQTIAADPFTRRHPAGSHRPTLGNDRAGGSRSAATTRKVHRVLSLVLAMAVKDDRLMRNPAAARAVVYPLCTSCVPADIIPMLVS